MTAEFPGGVIGQCRECGQPTLIASADGARTKCVTCGDIAQILGRPLPGDLDSYAEATLDTASYPGKGAAALEAQIYCLMGLIGETGELAAKMRVTLAAQAESTGRAVALAALDAAIGAGKTAEGIKRLFRSGKLEIPGASAASVTGSGDTDGIVGEWGDILWYWVRGVRECKLGPLEVLRINALKLRDRKERGVIQGSGDKR